MDSSRHFLYGITQCETLSEKDIEIYIKVLGETITRNYRYSEDQLLLYGKNYANYCSRTGAFWPKKKRD